MPKNKEKLSRPVFYWPLLQYLFEVVWVLTCRWTPKPYNLWRLFVLALFGAHVHPRAFVHSRARVTHPWHLTLRSRACLGDRAHAYALAPITLAEASTVAQEAYLCTGSHDFQNPSLPLIVRPIVVGKHAFIGARAFLLPGVTIGEHAIVGALSLVSRDVSARTTVAGNPARPMRHG